MAWTVLGGFSTNSRHESMAMTSPQAEYISFLATVNGFWPPHSPLVSLQRALKCYGGAMLYKSGPTVATGQKQRHLWVNTLKLFYVSLYYVSLSIKFIFHAKLCCVLQHFFRSFIRLWISIFWAVRVFPIVQAPREHVRFNPLS